MLKKIICFTIAIASLFTLTGCLNRGSNSETIPIVDATISDNLETNGTEKDIAITPNGYTVVAKLHLSAESLDIVEKIDSTSRTLGKFREGDEIIVLGQSAGGNWLKVYFYDSRCVGKVGYCLNGDYFKEGPLLPIFKFNEEDVVETSPIETTEPTEDIETVPTETESTENAETKPIADAETVPLETEPIQTEPDVEDESTIETTPETTSPEITEPEEDDSKTMALENQGTYGRLIIPKAEVSCQLNLVNVESDEASSLAQQYTDLEDSAAFFKYGNMYIISDHRDQGFARLEAVETNDLAYIGCGDEVIEIYCYKTHYGKNGLDKLFTEYNESGTGFDGYLIYTFSDTKEGYDIFMTYWREKPKY